METELSSEQALLRDAIRDVVAKETSFAQVRDLEARQQMDEALWGVLAELGWLALPVPESLGGGGGSLTDLAIVVEELARRAAMVPYAETHAAVVTLVRHGALDTATKLAAALGRGEAIPVPAFPAADPSLAGVENGRLSGFREIVDYGQFATHLVVDAGGELVLADAKQQSVVASPLLNIAQTPVASLRLDDAMVEPVGGPAASAFLLQLCRSLAAIQCLGYARQAFDMTIAYVKDRIQFGRPIGSFQAVQHHCADMAIMVESTRFMSYEAVWALDVGVESGEEIGMAKAWASRAAVEVTALAHQLHGGVGVTLDYDLHFFGRRAKERALAWGTVPVLLELAGAAVDGPRDWSV
jgi:3-oxocholest-4-en-26-oyl-CoA dehydrogenase beta subunit